MASPDPRSSVRNDGTIMVKRITPDDCWGAIIDVQEFFLSQVGSRPARSRIR